MNLFSLERPALDPDVALFSALENALEKLETAAEKCGLGIQKKLLVYPVSFSFYPMEDPDQVVLCFTFSGGGIQLTSRIEEAYSLTDKQVQKLKNAAKAVHDLYLQHWFSRKEVRFLHAAVPLWRTEAGGLVVLLAPNYQP